MTPGRDIEPRLGQIPCLEEMLDRMIAVLPDKPDQAFRFLDLGGGAGTVSERLLTKFTETDCTLIEATEAERDQAVERLVTFGDRATIIDGDFARVELPRDFDLVVSLGRFHGLGDIERRAVFRAAYSVLLPGGQLLVADQVQGPTERLEAEPPIPSCCLAGSCSSRTRFKAQLKGWKPFIPRRRTTWQWTKVFWNFLQA